MIYVYIHLVFCSLFYVDFVVDLICAGMHSLHNFLFL